MKGVEPSSLVYQTSALTIELHAKRKSRGSNPQGCYTHLVSSEAPHHSDGFHRLSQSLPIALRRLRLEESRGVEPPSDLGHAFKACCVPLRATFQRYSRESNPSTAALQAASRSIWYCITAYPLGIEPRPRGLESLVLPLHQGHMASLRIALRFTAYEAVVGLLHYEAV